MEKQRIIIINEQQYRSLLLNEELHYPKFLDRIKEDILKALKEKIREQASYGNYKFSFILPYSCQYTDEIQFDVMLDPNGNITDKYQYGCFYNNTNNRLVDGKLLCPTIIVYCPCQKNRFLGALLKVCLSHELTHLYDDWSELSRNGSGINYNPKNIDTTMFVRDNVSKLPDDLYKCLSMLSYMSLKVESQAFLSQTVQELESIGCTLYNYKEKLKETLLYHNLNKSYEGVVKNLGNVSDDTLYDCNEYIITSHPKAVIPKLNVEQFNADRYREMLSKWAEKIYHKAMKYYGSIVQYYINTLQEEKNKTTSMFVF